MVIKGDFNKQTPQKINLPQEYNNNNINNKMKIYVMNKKQRSA